MHGSSEIHTGYIYHRSHGKSTAKIMKGATCPVGGEGLPNDVPCDPRFVEAWRTTREGLESLCNNVRSQVLDNLASHRPRRWKKTTV